MPRWHHEHRTSDRLRLPELPEVCSRSFTCEGQVFLPLPLGSLHHQKDSIPNRKGFMKRGFFLVVLSNAAPLKRPKHPESQCSSWGYSKVDSLFLMIFHDLPTNSRLLPSKLMRCVTSNLLHATQKPLR